MKTLSDLRTDVQLHLDEIVSRYWTPSELNTWINEGARDIARKSETLQALASINALTGVQQYDMPQDLCRMHRMEFAPAGSINVYPLEPRSLNEMDSVWGISQKVSQSYPVYYSLWGFPPNLKVILYPTPSQPGSLAVWYYRLPLQALSDTDTIEVPEGWHDLVVLFCEYVAKRKDGDQTWAEAKQLYEERLGDMIDMTRRWVDSAGVMTTGTANIPGWLYDPDAW